MASALSGIKVIDLCGMGTAFLAATMLGDMGAEVLKIDAPPWSGGRGAGQGTVGRPEHRRAAQWPEGW